HRDLHSFPTRRSSDLPSDHWRLSAMANSKARSRSDRTVAAVSATPTSHPVRKPAAKAPEPEPIEDLQDELDEAQEAKPAGMPSWLQVASFVLAILGLV